MTAEHILAAVLYGAGIEAEILGMPDETKAVWQVCAPYLGQMRWGYDFRDTAPREGSVWRHKKTGEVITIGEHFFSQGSSFVSVGKWGVNPAHIHRDYNILEY